VSVSVSLAFLQSFRYGWAGELHATTVPRANDPMQATFSKAYFHNLTDCVIRHNFHRKSILFLSFDTISSNICQIVKIPHNMSRYLLCCLLSKACKIALPNCNCLQLFFWFFVGGGSDDCILWLSE
jgi:hypothetical protein